MLGCIISNCGTQAILHVQIDTIISDIRLRCFHQSLCYSIVILYPCECIASFLDKRYKQYWFMLIPSRLDCSDS